MSEYYPDWLASEDEPIFDYFCDTHGYEPKEDTFLDFKIQYGYKFENHEDDQV